MLTNGGRRRKNGGKTADEGRRTASQTLLQAQDGHQQPSELWTRRQTSDDGESNNSLRFSSPTTAELLLFTFATVLSKSGSDQLLINLFACRPRRSSLFSLTIHSTPSSPLNHRPMLAPSRNTTEQRFHMDAVELGDDSGLSEPPNWTLFPPARRVLSAGFNTGLGNNTGRNQLWTSGREGGR